MWGLSYWAHSTSQHQRMVVCFLHDFGRIFYRLSIIRIIWIWGKNRLKWDALLIVYHLYNLKNVKITLEGVLLLVKLQAQK